LYLQTDWQKRTKTGEYAGKVCSAWEHFPDRFSKPVERISRDTITLSIRDNRDISAVGLVCTILTSKINSTLKTHTDHKEE
jgi:hypothetical protein